MMIVGVSCVGARTRETAVEYHQPEPRLSALRSSHFGLTTIHSYFFIRLTFADAARRRPCCWLVAPHTVQ